MQTHEFKLPDLGEGMQEAEIVQWLVHPGDTIKLDQAMVKVETDKAVVEIPSPVAGRVAEIRVEDGQVAKLGQVLVVLETAQASQATAARQDKAPATTQSEQTISAQAVPASGASSSVSAYAQTNGAAPRRVLAAPAVRKLAFELGVPLEQIPATHPSGRVTIEDVQNFATAQKGQVQTEEKTTHLNGDEKPTGSFNTTIRVTTPASSPAGQRGGAATGTTEPVAGETERRELLSGLRKRIAEHMEHSWRTIPHATAFDEVDGMALAELRKTLQPVVEARGLRLSYMPLLVKLLLPALKEFPVFNASLDEQTREIIYKSSYHIGLATAAPEGLLVPVIRDADRLTLLELAGEIERLVEGGRKRTLMPRELSGSTFTLNNVGSFGGSSGTPIINHPEVAILAVGRLQEKAVVQQGVVGVRLMLPLALSFDHRLIDGAMAGAFLARFKALVENPQQLMLDMH